MNTTRSSKGRADGGQAFPSEFFETEHGDQVRAFAGSPGMSLRDWFAGQALVAQLGYPRDPADGPLVPDDFASMAYGIADAMLAARKASEG